MAEAPFTIVWVSSAADLKRKLTLLRLKHKLSIRELSNLMDGLAYGTIWGWEQAPHLPSAESLLKVQEVYRVFFRWREDGNDQGVV